MSQDKILMGETKMISALGLQTVALNGGADNVTLSVTFAVDCTTRRTKCAAGQFLKGCGGNQWGTCEDCKSDTFQPKVNSTASQCMSCTSYGIRCSYGQQVYTPCGNITAGSCGPCPIGKYQDHVLFQVEPLIAMQVF
eukprot:TRINITY_DN4788_c0_g1_i2.p1 TRINITY_DN4788_c0_g1~~TRINITY_DN4788_c0_g1_i2.p1  ORF type:complete len:138 (+),score=1.50 TRINITY_DN4788_c0_g1_i2:425-838(+)